MKNLKIWILALLFIAPGILAILVYKNPEWLMLSTTNVGTFLKPPIEFKALGPSNKWHLLLCSARNCEQSCLQKLDKLARVRLALGRHLYQVDLQLVLPQEIVISHKTQEQLRDRDIGIVKYAQELKPSLIDMQAYIADPQNNIILAYPQNIEPKLILRDLQHLVKG